MAPKPTEAPALFSLLVFLSINYAVGYGIGIWLTGSTVGAAALALVMPCLSMFAIALLKKPVVEDRTLDEA